MGLGSKKGALLTAIIVIVALIVAMATIQSTQASIDYWFEQPATLTAGLNHVSVYCRNGGGSDSDFYLAVKFGNAAFSSQKEMPYTKMDDATVKIKFVLHKEDSSQRTIYFTTNTTDSVTITLTLQSINPLQFLKANDLYPTQLTYQRNTESQVYNCTNLQ
jgi:hypothetical protein